MYQTPGNSKRRVWLVSKSHVLYCPNGHRIRLDSIVLGHGGIRCTAKMNAHAGDRPTECAAFLWLLNMPGGWRLVAEVTIEEMKEAQARHLSIEEMLGFLGVEGPMLAL